MGQRPEHLVAAQMTMRVVDVLEAIEIDERETDLRAGSPAPLQFLVKPVDEPPMIEKAGEAIPVHDRT